MSRLRKDQSGAGLIIVIVILLIVGTIGAVFVSLINTESFTAMSQSRGLEVVGIAEGGMEKALYEFRNGTACNSLDAAGVALGSGTFDIDGTVYAPAATFVNQGGGITAVATTIPVDPIGTYAPHGRIRIDSEWIDYTGWTGTSFTGARRGSGGTTAAVHADNAAVTQNQCLIRSTGSISGPLSATQRVLEASGWPAGNNPVWPAGKNPMMVYAKGAADPIPYFRQWNGSAWGAEQSATAVPAAIEYLVLKFSRTRNEAILGTLSSNGDIRVQVWNGAAWSATTLLADINADDDFRGFDIEYETAGDRAVVVYNNASAADPAFRIWNGVAWSAAATINIPTLGVPRWIELAPNPLVASDEMALITLDSASDVYGMRWTGIAWNNMGVAATWDASAATATGKCIGVAYEQLSGRAVFIWGDSNTDDQYYRIWNGVSLTANTLLNIPAMGNDGDWVRLVSRPDSNQLMYGVKDQNQDLNTALWSGPPGDSWTVHAEHDASTEDTGSRNFDIVFESHPANAGLAWLIWGDSTTVSRRQWNSSTSTWGAITTVGDDTALVQLMADPTTGVVFSALYEDNSSATDDTWEMRLTGGGAVWSAKFTVWGGATVLDPVMERVFLAAGRGSALTVIDRQEIYP